MRTAVGILDRNDWKARTDVIVVVDPARETLTWVPRDLYSDRLKNRINNAFARGGHELFRAVLADLGHITQHSLVVQPAATARALQNAEVTVTVETEASYYYPLTPLAPIEEGRKIVHFKPPRETLSGERIHQWLGARLRVDRKTYYSLPDFERIHRQQAFLCALLRDGFDFQQLLAAPDLDASGPGAAAELRQVKENWAYLLDADCEPKTINGMAILVRTKKTNADPPRADQN